MEVIDLVRKIIGPIQPIGDSSIDSERFSNLTEMVGLIEDLLSDLQAVAKYRQAPEHSVSKAGKYANDALETFFD